MEENTYQLVDDLFRMVLLIRKKFMKPLEELSSIDLTPKQLQALLLIYYGPNMSMGEISDDLQVSKQQLTKIINCLEEAGCVVRYQDETNRRNVRVKVSERGKQICEEIRAKIICLEESFFRNLSEEEIKAMKSSISVIRSVLESGK